MKNNKKGFTLIELMTVISIIAIFAAITVLVVSNTKDKGSNSAIKASVDTIRKQAEIFYNNNSLSYGAGSMATGTNCVTSPGANTIFNGSVSSDTSVIAKTITDVNTKAGGSSAAPLVACAQGNNAWAFAVVLKQNLGAYCVDSRGLAPKTTAAYTTAAAAINDTTDTCN